MFRLIPLLTLVFTPAAYACPLCDSATAGEVRTSFLDTASDPSVLLATVLPFAAVALVVGLLNHDFFDRRL